jgi:hypothetical protein
MDARQPRQLANESGAPRVSVNGCSAKPPCSCSWYGMQDDRRAGACRNSSRRHIGGGRGVVMFASCPFCCSASVSAARGLEFDPPRAVSAHFRRCDGARSWGPRRTVSRVGNCARRDLSPGHVARRWDVALLGRPASRQSVQAAMRGANAAVVGIPGLSTARFGRAASLHHETSRSRSLDFSC